MTVDSESSDQGSPELNALNAVVRALRTLSPELRKRVIDSAILLLGGSPVASSPLTSGIASPPVQSAASTGAVATDIRRLKELNKHKTAYEMAALIAYYLSEIVPADERQTTVGITDVTKYFKQAQFRLPNNPKMILVSA